MNLISQTPNRQKPRKKKQNESSLNSKEDALIKERDVAIKEANNDSKKIEEITKLYDNRIEIEQMPPVSQGDTENNSNADNNSSPEKQDINALPH